MWQERKVHRLGQEIYYSQKPPSWECAMFWKALCESKSFHPKSSWKRSQTFPQIFVLHMPLFADLPPTPSSFVKVKDWKRVLLVHYLLISDIEEDPFDCCQRFSYCSYLHLDYNFVIVWFAYRTPGIISNQSKNSTLCKSLFAALLFCTFFPSSKNVNIANKQMKS